MPIVSKRDVIFPDKAMAEVLNGKIPASWRRGCGDGIDVNEILCFYK